MALDDLPVPVGTEFEVKVESTVTKSVVCCHCEHAYAYDMRRTASGHGFSLFFLNDRGARSRARARAEAALKRTLAEECDPVPCPECGSYQPNMIPEVPAQHLAALWVAGWVALLLAGVTCVTLALAGRSSAGSVAAGMGAIGVGLIVTRSFLGWCHDPNGGPDVEQRKAGGRERVDRDANSRPRPRPRLEMVQEAVGLGRDGAGGVWLREVTRVVGAEARLPERL